MRQRCAYGVIRGYGSSTGFHPSHLIMTLHLQRMCLTYYLNTLVLAPGTMFQRDGTLEEVDPEIASIIKNEKGRQVRLVPLSTCLLLGTR